MILHIYRRRVRERFQVVVGTKAYGQDLQRAIREKTGIRRRCQVLKYCKTPIASDRSLRSYGIGDRAKIDLEDLV